jgi:hypothetical protein
MLHLATNGLPTLTSSDNQRQQLVMLDVSSQDCFGGCTDPSQGFYGVMDEVRIWKTVRSQDDIIRHMRWASGLENNADLIAYWQFNDPDSDNGQFR